MAKRKEKFHRLANEYVVSLFPIFMLVDTFGKGFGKVIKTACDFCLGIQNNAVTYYYLPSTWQKSHDTLVERIKKDYAFLPNAFKKMETLGLTQAQDTKKFIIGAKEMTNRQLNEAYQKYVKTNSQVYLYGLLLPLLDYQNTTFVADELKSILKKQKAEKYYSLLTTPTRETYNKKQELALLEIFKQISRQKKLLEALKKLDSADFAKELKKRDKNIWSSLAKHTKKYVWVFYVYEGPAADENYFIDFLKDYARRRMSPDTSLSEHKRNIKDVIKKQNEAIKALSLSDYERHIIQIAPQIIFMKPYRRELQSWSYYHMEFLLKEIGRRLGLSLKQARMLLPGEVSKALQGKDIDRHTINDRIQAIVYGYTPNKIMYSGKKAVNFLDKNTVKEKAIKNVRVINADTACAGKASGVVRLINTPEDMSKMQSGDILVSAATNPNLMPAIRQSAAIVTDEGGLTCHAAIVSRELNIPCVVGAKIATRALKDGDRVEVDAGKGIVKKLPN